VIDADRPDGTIERATALAAESRIIAAASGALDTFERAAATSSTAALVRRAVTRMRGGFAGERRCRLLTIAVIAAGVHVAVASTLPAAIAPTIPITAATLVAAVLALTGR